MTNDMYMNIEMWVKTKERKNLLSTEFVNVGYVCF